MRRILLGTCVLLGIAVAAGQSARASSTRFAEKGDLALFPAKPATEAIMAVAEERHVPFFGRLCPLEERFFTDAADGRLDEFSLLDAALIASGAERVEALQFYAARLATLVDELQRSNSVAGSPHRQAQAVFEFMHRRVLHGGYHVDCTDLRLAFDQGRFNCVSASVLFNCLAGEFRLPVCGLEMPGHAMSRLLLDAGSFDLETTCPQWFRLSDDAGKRAQALAKTVGPISADVRAQAREVAPVEIAAMIYYNRGVDLLAGRRFAEAADANAKALRLDPQSTTARGNLLAVLNNWAVALGSDGRHAEAIDLLRRGLAYAPRYEAFALNYVHVHYQWVDRLCRAGRFEQALAVLTRAAEELPDREYFRLAPLDVRRRWAANRGQLTAGSGQRVEDRGQ